METPDFSHTAQIAKRSGGAGCGAPLGASQNDDLGQLRMELLGARLRDDIGVARRRKG